MADFSLQLTFNSQRQAKEVLSRIAASQGFKIEKRKPVERAVAGAAAAEANADQQCPPPQVQLQPQTKAARQLEYSQVISFVCSNWYRDERCGWFIAMHRVATEPEERWETYTLNDVHCKTCKPARVQSKRAREDSVSTVASIETDESDLEIPREIRGPYVRSPSLSIPDPVEVKRQAEERSQLARPPHTVQQLVQAAAANAAASAQMESAQSSVVTADGTPVLTPSISLSTANSQPKSPSPPFGPDNDDYGDNDIFQQYMNSLDNGADRAATQRGSAMGAEDMENLWAIIQQPLGSALGLGGDFAFLSGGTASTSTPAAPPAKAAAGSTLPAPADAASAVPDGWRADATGAHGFLTGLDEPRQPIENPAAHAALAGEISSGVEVAQREDAGFDMYTTFSPPPESSAEVHSAEADAIQSGATQAEQEQAREHAQLLEDLTSSAVPQDMHGSTASESTTASASSEEQDEAAAQSDEQEQTDDAAVATSSAAAPGAGAKAANLDVAQHAMETRQPSPQEAVQPEQAQPPFIFGGLQSLLSGQMAHPQQSSRAASAEQYISPWNLMSPSKSNEQAADSASGVDSDAESEEDEDAEEEEEEEDHQPVASTSAIPMDADVNATNSAQYSHQQYRPYQPSAAGPSQSHPYRQFHEEKEEEEEGEEDNAFDIYQIFPSYAKAEEAILQNAKNFKLPMKVRWNPDGPHADFYRGACFECVHQCGYEMRLSDDYGGSWRVTQIDGAHGEQCHPRAQRGRKDTTAAAAAAVARGGAGAGASAGAARVNKKKKASRANAAYLGEKRRARPPKKNDKGKQRADNIDEVPTSSPLPKSRRALSPISTQRRARPRRQYSSDGLSSSSSSDGVIVVASQRRATSATKDLDDGLGWGAYEDHEAARTTKSPGGSAASSARKRRTPRDDNVDGRSPLRASQTRPQPSSAGRSIAEPIDIGDSSDDDDEVSRQVCRQLQTNKAGSRIIDLDAQAGAGAGADADADGTSGTPTGGGAVYAHKKLPASSGRNVPTKPFGRRNRQPRQKRITHAIVEEPYFLPVRVATGAEAKDRESRALGAQLNGGYWSPGNDRAAAAAAGGAPRDEDEYSGGDDAAEESDATYGTGDRPGKRRRISEQDKGSETRVLRKRVRTAREQRERPPRTAPATSSQSATSARATRRTSIKDAQPTKAPIPTPAAELPALPEPARAIKPRLWGPLSRRREMVLDGAGARQQSPARVASPLRHLSPAEGSAASEGRSRVEKITDLQPSTRRRSVPSEDPQPASLSGPARPRRTTTGGGAPTKTEAHGSPDLVAPPIKLTRSMSLSEAGFSAGLVQRLAVGGFLSVSHLTLEGLTCTREDFALFAARFAAEVKTAPSHAEERRLRTREGVRELAVRLVEEIRVRAALLWEMDANMDDDV